MLITPAIAKAMLEKNVSNRRVRPGKVNQYAYEMANGLWKEDTYEFIKISTEGNLIDGQHRLAAIIKCGLAMSMPVAYNVPKDVYLVLDTGLNRNTGDIFKISGIKNSSSIPSVIKTSLKFTNQTLSRGAKDLTNSETVEIYEQNPDFWQTVFHLSSVWYNSFAKILPISVIGGFYSSTYFKNSIDAKKFMDQLCTGRDIQNETINLLRNTLMKDKMSSKKMSRDFIMILILKTWNAYRTQTNLKLLKWSPEFEKYPSAI